MAEYLASIFGTEKDKVNCSFYFKIGACRHGDKCSRIHNRPSFSQTILLQNLYQNPKLEIHRAESMFSKGIEASITDAEEQQHFDEFFEEIFTELEDKYGEIEEMNVCDNIGEHMIGNVYVKFKREEDAEKAVNAVNNRWFNGMPVYAELSPVTDFREACCRQYEMGECTRGGFCNFMHLKPISYELRRELYNRDHPWRSLADDDNESGVDAEEEKKRKKQRRKLKKLRKRKKLAKKRLTILRAIDWNAKLVAGSSATNNTNQINTNVNSLQMSSSLLVDSIDKTTKKRRKTNVELKKISDESPILPLAYQRVHCSDDSSSSSDNSSHSYRSRSRLPSPFRDIFPLKKRPTTNGSCFTTVVDNVFDLTNVVDNERSDCGKGGFCNFMHLKPISRELRRKLYGRKRHSSPSRASGRYGSSGGGSGGRRSRSRSRSRDRNRRSGGRRY